MKKLRLALTLLFALSCSLFLFACGGDKYISDIELEGQKTAFTEGDAFSVGDLKVTVYYQGQDEGVVLEADEYDVDSSAFKSTDAGDYEIKVTPKNQTLDEGAEAKSVSYMVTVDHKWSAPADGVSTCPCGAKKKNYSDLTSQFVCGPWGDVVTYNPGSSAYSEAKGAITGEAHGSLGTLVSGQSVSFTLRIDEIDKGSVWNTPLMGIRDGAVGTLPREDAWVIATGPSNAFVSPYGVATGYANTVGSAAADSPLWQVFQNGKSWKAEDMLPNTTDPDNVKYATDTIYYSYQTDGIFRIRHTLTTAAGATQSFDLTIRVPDSGYELVAYGEKVTYTVTDVSYVENREVSTYDATLPTNLEQPEGKLFDKTGIKTTVKFSKGDDLVGEGDKALGNFYAYRNVPTEEGASTYNKTRVNLATEPLSADLYDFSAEFGGKTTWLTADGKPTELKANATKAEADAAFLNASANAKIKVIPNYISGAIATLLKDSEKSYESPDLAFDYAVNNESKITLSVSGTPVALSSENTISGATHFVAFRILGVASANGSSFDSATASESTVKCNLSTAENGRQNISLIVPLTKDSAKTFTLTLKSAGEDIPTNVLTVDLTDVLANLSGVSASAIVTNTSYSLDNGGTYTVTYSAVGDFTFDENLNLYVSSVSKSIKTLKESISDPDKTAKIGSTEITKAEITAEGKTLTVQYKLPAPDLANLNASNSSLALTIRKGNTTVISTNIKLDYVVSEAHDANGVPEVTTGVYAKAAGKFLYLFAPKQPEENVRDQAGFSFNINIENATASSYSVGVNVVNGVATIADMNDLTASATARLATFGQVNNLNDYDRAQVLIMVIDVTALGVRTDSQTQVYHFTVNENVLEGKSEAGTAVYKIYTVGKDDKITAEDKDASSLTRKANIVQFSCLDDGTDAYELKYKNDPADTEEKSFYFGALLKQAPGTHLWNPSTGAERNCTRCGAHFFTVTEGQNKFEFSDLPAITRVANPDTDPKNWWASPTADIPVSGDFFLRFTWENTDGNYAGDGAIEMYATQGETKNYFGYRTFVADYNPGPDSSKLCGGKGTDTTTITIAGTAATALGLGTAVDWKGDVVVLVYRYDTTLVIDSTLTAKDKDNADVVINVTTKIVKFTKDDLNVHISGNHFFCDNIKYGLGAVSSVVTTGSTKTTLQSGRLGTSYGERNNSTPYTGDGQNGSNGPLWSADFKPGMKIEMVGNMTSAAGGAWNGAFAYLYEADTDPKVAKLDFRIDNYYNGATNPGVDETMSVNYNFKLTKKWQGFTPNTMNGSDWAAALKNFLTNKDLVEKIVWDWTDESVIKISYSISSATAGATFNQGYEVTPDGDNEFKTSYKVGLGVDNAWFGLTKLAITEKVEKKS